MDRPLRIFQVSTWERMGGAEKVAHTLFRNLRGGGHDAKLVVGTSVTDDPNVIELPNHVDRGLWHDGWRGAHRRLSWLDGLGARARKVRNLAMRIAEPSRFSDCMAGREEFDFPGTRWLVDLEGAAAPDIIQCHNLHGNYFDLRLLPELSRRVPVILTLHDTWLLAGHCAYSIGCERWKIGCGACPDLAIYPPLKRDGTALNWEAKRQIFKQSKVYVTAPCQWVLDQVKQSILAPAVIESRVIPYGLDLSTFKPGDRSKAREALEIPDQSKVLLFAANGVRQNPYKDFKTLRAAVEQIAQQWEPRRAAGEGPLVFIALGDDSPAESIGSATVRFVPYQKDPARVAQFYQAADVYVHAARADTFPNTILEALACGVPVVATGVCGIPEQLQSVDGDSKNPTGILVPAGDSAAMAAGVMRLLSDEPLRSRLASNAAADAAVRFDSKVQTQQHIQWYREIQAPHQKLPTSAGRPATPPREKHIPALDGVRGVAILMVLLSAISVTHVYPTRLESFFFKCLEAGWWGVDLFFVLSGFLITGILLRAKGSDSYFRTFYIRRSLRIFPLYFGLLTALFLIMPLFMGTPSQTQGTGRQIWLWTYLTNVALSLHRDWFYFQFQNVGLGHLWSLAVEEHFYLLWPLVVLLCGPRRLKQVCWTLILTAMAFRCFFFFVAKNSVGVYTLTPCRMDALAIGALLAVMLREPAAIARARRFVPAAIGVALFAAVATLLLLLTRHHFDERDRAVATLGFFLFDWMSAAMVFVAVAAPAAFAFNRLLGSRFLRSFGRYSYAIYLLNPLIEPWLLARVGPKVLEPRVHSMTGATLLYGLCYITCAWLIGFASWNFFERHALKLKRLFSYGNDAPTSASPSARVERIELVALDPGQTLEPGTA